MSKRKKTVRLFTYGTLKKGKALHSWVQSTKFVGDDTIKGELYTLSAYPAVLLDGKDDVPGEVYAIPKDTFRSIRAMEECSGYRTVDARTAKGRKVKVFEYKDTSIRKRCPKINNF